MENILVLGDSHARVFQYKLFERELGCRFYVGAVGGATASGLSNPNAHTQSYRKFRQWMDQFEYRMIILLLGEVDTGYVIWWRSREYGESPEKMERFTRKMYRAFILECKERCQVVVISTPLPTIRDGVALGEVAKVRKDVGASLVDRTRLTLHFNSRMRMWCAMQQITFIDCDPDMTGPDGLIKPEYVHPDPQNHHLNSEVYAYYLVERLKEVIV